MSRLVTFASSVGRVSGVRWSNFRQRAKEFSTAIGIEEPVAVDSLGTLVWSVPDSREDSRFAREVEQACLVPCLARSLADLRALRDAAVARAHGEFREAYNPSSHRVRLGTEVWELGLAMASAPLTKQHCSKTQRVRLLNLLTDRDGIVLKLRLKPPGSRLDWGKSVVSVLRPMAVDPKAVVMCRGNQSIDKVFKAAGMVELPPAADEAFQSNRSASILRCAQDGQNRSRAELSNVFAGRDTRLVERQARTAIVTAFGRLA